MTAILTLFVGMLVIPAVILGGVVVGDRVVALLPRRRQAAGRAWLWLILPIVLGGEILLYPLVQTVVMAFQNANGAAFVGVANFAWVFSDAVLPVLFNNLIWLVVLPIVTVVLGLVVATLADRVRYEGIVRAIMILPMAISFSAAAVIWRLMYAYQPKGYAQLGTVDGVINALGGTPLAFLSDPRVATWALIAIGVWMSTGTATLMFSAALKSVDGSILEAARLDGAGEVRVFCSMVIPQILPTLTVLATTQIIFALKIFDIVYTMTNGAYGTDVIANREYSELFLSQDYGKASAIAIILLLASIPVILINLRHFRKAAVA